MSNDQQPADSYDVAILGGGLAGLTPESSRRAPRPASSSPRSARGPRARPPSRSASRHRRSPATTSRSARLQGAPREGADHEERPALLVPGGRQQRARAARRARPREPPPVPATSSTAAFENFLGEQALAAGIDLFGSARVRDIELGDDAARDHVHARRQGDTDERTIKARWVVDASGRAFTLKRKLGLLEDNGHVINSSWFRLAGGLDLEDWADPDDEEFFGRARPCGRRTPRRWDRPSPPVRPAGEPEPGRVDHVSVVLEQPELLFSVKARPLASRIQRALTFRSSVLSLPPRVYVISCCLVAELDVPDAGTADEVDPGGKCLLAEEVLEAPAVELVGVDGQAARRAALDALGELAVVPGGEPEAQAVLGDLLLLEVLLEAEHVREVLARDLLCRLPTLNAASRAGPSRFSAMKMVVSGRCCLSCRPRVNPARPPPRIATS